MKKLIPILLLFCVVASTQTAVLMPLPRYFAVDALGKPFAAGCVWTYAAGNNRLLASYRDSIGTPNTNPVILAADGSADIWLATGQAYKIVLYSAGPNPNSTCSTGSLIRTTDNVTGLATQIANSFAAVTNVSFATTPVFTALAQNQLFRMFLTGNVTSSSLVMSGIAVPALVTFELTQDSTGGRPFAWPPNTSGGFIVSTVPNETSSQTFYWDGTTAYSIAPQFLGLLARFNIDTAPAGDSSGTIASTHFVHLPSNIPANALVPGSNGQCEVTAGGISGWGGCAQINGSSNGPPTCVVGTGGGFGTGGTPTCTFTTAANDAFGSITVHTGTTPAAGTAAIVTVHLTRNYTNGFCSFAPLDGSQPPAGAIIAINFITLNSFVLYSEATALTGATNYNWSYHCDLIG